MSERALSPEMVFAARPTVHVNGDVRPRVSSLLVAMDLTEHEDGLSALELRLTNVLGGPGQPGGFAFEDEQSIKLGDRIVVYAGVETSPTELFRGVVTGLEAEFPEAAAPTLVVLVEDALQAARMARRTKTWEQCRIASVAEEVASRIGVTPRVDGFLEDIGTQVQLNESDLAFLRRLLARNNGDVQVVGGELQVARRDRVRRGSVTLNLHSQLRRATVTADLAHQVTAVTVTGWDGARGQRVSGTCRSAARGPGSGRLGGELLRQALRERAEQIGHLAVADDAEARSLAEASYFDRQRRFVVVDGVADGNPAIRVGTHLTLGGLGPRFSNTYYVVRCRHRYDLMRGYETDFTGECAFLGTP